MGKIEAICISTKKGTPKYEITTATIIKDFGIEGDAHAGNWHRQISLLSLEKVEEFKKLGANVNFGAFGENLVVSGFDFRSLPVGTVFCCGDVVLEMTQIGKECHTHCAIYHQVGKCIMPTQGVFARVICGGEITVGDEMKLVKRDEAAALTAAVITLSDRCSSGEREDTSGPAAVGILREAGYKVEEQLLLSDDGEKLKKELIRLSDMRQINLIITTGGTGFSNRDNTPEATMEIAHRNAPGIAEAIRAYSVSITEKGMLSRGNSVLRGHTLIINLPGSCKAVNEILNYILPTLKHGLCIANGLADN